jgi:cysteine dioxygenase
MSFNSTFEEERITSVQQLTNSLNQIFKRHEASPNWSSTKSLISTVLQNTDLSSYDLNTYTYWDAEKAYTRNLIHTDGKHYTLLLLCWNPQRESSIHNHPCDGCFIRTVRGCIRETLYSVHPDTNEIRQEKCRFFNEGQVSFMNDDIGLHKIGNPSKETGCVSLHLYTPPFKYCNVWANAGVGELKKCDKGVMGFFSVKGFRTPQFEGRPGRHVKLLEEIHTHRFSDKAEGVENCSQNVITITSSAVDKMTASA